MNLQALCIALVGPGVWEDQRKYVSDPTAGFAVRNKVLFFWPLRTMRETLTDEYISFYVG